MNSFFNNNLDYLIFNRIIRIDSILKDKVKFIIFNSYENDN